VNILRLQKRVRDFLATIGRGRNQSPSLNAMTVILLIYRGQATTIRELAAELGKTEPGMKATLRSLGNGSTAGRTGYGFILPSKLKNAQGGSTRINQYYLTDNGRKFAKILTRFFGK